MNGEKRPVRRRRKDARPQELIEAALLTFSQNGFAGTKIEDIAERAGVAKGTVYRYFETKDALFEAAVRENISPVFANMQVMAAAAKTASAVDLLEGIIHKIYSELLNNPTRRIVMQILLSEGSRFPHLTEFYYNEVISKGKKILLRVVKRGVESGEFRRSPILASPELIMAPAIMAAVWLTTFQHVSPIDLERFAKAHADLVLNGLRSGRRE